MSRNYPALHCSYMDSLAPSRRRRNHHVFPHHTDALVGMQVRALESFALPDMVCTAARLGSPASISPSGMKASPGGIPGDLAADPKLRIRGTPGRAPVVITAPRCLKAKELPDQGPEGGRACTDEQDAWLGTRPAHELDRDPAVVSVGHVFVQLEEVLHAHDGSDAATVHVSALVSILPRA